MKITNHGPSPEAYFIDARLNKQASVTLAPQTTSSLTLPNVTGVVPEYLVPSETTRLTAQVTAPTSQFFDLSYPFGDPDLISSSGTTSNVAFDSPDVPAGSWYVTPFLAGPFEATAAKNVTANVSLNAITTAFDNTVSSPTGDMWLSSLNASAGFTPYVVNPGQSVTIPVTITPSGAAGLDGQRDAVPRRLVGAAGRGDLQRDPRSVARRQRGRGLPVQLHHQVVG